MNYLKEYKYNISQNNKIMKHQLAQKNSSGRWNNLDNNNELKGLSQEPSRPNHNFNCECEMCCEYQHKKFKKSLEERTQSINSKIRNRITTTDASKQQILQSNYYWVIKHLMLSQKKVCNYSLNIHITQTLFFKDGQASEMFLNKQFEDLTIKKISRQKLNYSFVQKLMADRRRKYKQYVKVKSGRKKLQQKKKLLFGQKEVKKQIKDAVLIKFIDGYQQLLTQNQFLAMSLKRKQDPVWRQVSSIRNFINITNPQDENSSYIVVKFNRDKVNNQQLFERSKILMKINGEYINKNEKSYISREEQAKFCKQLQQTSQKTYSQYLVYQIINFIQYFYDEQINLIVAGIYFDEIGNPFLHQIYKLETKSLVKFEWTHEIYRKRIDEEQSRVLVSKTVKNEKLCEKGAQGIIAVMHLAYEKTKEKLGLNLEDEDNQQEVANNNFFKTLYPQFNHNICDLLKDPNLTLNDFKKNYLGHSNKKKPIIKEFTSNLIKTIHLTSPKLRTSSPHSFILTPRKQTRGHSLLMSERKRETVRLSPLNLHQSRRFYQTLTLRQN